MSKLDKDAVIEKFTAAYTAANGKAPTIEAKGGWYSVDGGKNIRLAQLDELAEQMTSAPKAAEPPKAKAAKPAAKKKATKPSKQSSFSVKDFYTQQILASNPGAKAPR